MEYCHIKLIILTDLFIQLLFIGIASFRESWTRGRQILCGYIQTIVLAADKSIKTIFTLFLQLPIKECHKSARQCMWTVPDSAKYKYQVHKSILVNICAFD